MLLLSINKPGSKNSSSKIKSSRERSKIPYGNFAIRGPPYDDHDDGGLQTIFSMDYAGFGPRTANIFRRMVGCQRRRGLRRTRTMKMTNHTYIVVVTSISSTIIQTRVPFQIL
jgi:hypothetical protein